ncbi:MAG: diguanylate cyclase [Aquificae bacterium]|nr:diguanylate cyclase [Aquificota bacterium]
MASQKNSSFAVIGIDRDYTIVHQNDTAVKEYGKAEGKKCYAVFNHFDRPCYKATQYTCPIKILEDINSDTYTGVYTLSAKPSKYVVITVERDGDIFVQKHRILDRQQLDLIDFRKIFNFLSEGLVLIDKKQNKVKFLNESFIKIFNLEAEAGRLIDADVKTLNGKLPAEMEGILLKEGEIPDNQEFISHYRDKYLVVKKITIEDKYVLWSFEEKKETDLSDEIFRVLLEMSPVGIFLQCGGRFMYANPTLASILQTNAGELIGASIFNYIHPEDRKKVRELVRNSKGKLKLIVRVLTAKGETKWAEIILDTINFKGKECNIGSCVDITEMKELEDNLRRLATIDQLTGIYNRYSFEKFLEEEINRAERYGTRFALIMFDVDNFKQINDTYGHQIGDRVLKELVKVVKSNIRKSDIFARWGGEEFMILAPIKREEDAYKIAEKIRKKIESYHFDPVGRITVSLGISFYRKGDTIKSLVRRADAALYEAKKTGKNKTITAV